MKSNPPTAIPAILLLVAACSPQASVSPQPVASAAPPPVALAPARDPSKESLTIEFVPAGAGLSSNAAAQLDGAARLYRDAQPEVMIVAGHTDKVGPEYSNLLLSARRADVVKRALVARGVPAERLQIIALGEAEPDPAVTASRSVVVTWK